MNKQLGCFVVADSTKCTGCKACELACFTEHNKVNNNLGKTVGTVTIPVTPKLYLTRTETFCVPVQCKHCEDSPCLNVCSKKAISRVNGQIIVDESKCIGCKDCMTACPFGAISILPVSNNGKVLLQAGSDEVQKAASKCDLCAGIEGGPACVRVCPNSALRLVNPQEECRDKNLRAAESLYLMKNA